MQQTNHLANLYLLVQVIDAGGLSAASRQLGMTRSMVSRRIIELERQLGVRLLHRHARHFAITPAGEQIYRHALAMCEAAQAATSAARAAQDPASGLVRIGMDTLLLPLAGQLFADFSLYQPQTRLTLGNDNLALLLKQQLDVILSVGELPPEHADIVALPLGSLRRVMVASPALWQRLQQPRHLDQLQDQDCLGYGPRDWGLRGTPAQHRRPRLITDHLPTLLAMARAGAGVAQLPMYMCHDDLAAERLQLVFEAFEARPLALHALTLARHSADQTSANFIAFTHQYLADMPSHGIMPAG